MFLSNIQELKQCNPPQFFYHIIHDHLLLCLFMEIKIIPFPSSIICQIWAYYKIAFSSLLTIVKCRKINNNKVMDSMVAIIVYWLWSLPFRIYIYTWYLIKSNKMTTCFMSKLLVYFFNKYSVKLYHSLYSLIASYYHLR